MTLISCLAKPFRFDGSQRGVQLRKSAYPTLRPSSRRAEGLAPTRQVPQTSRCLGTKRPSQRRLMDASGKARFWPTAPIDAPRFNVRYRESDGIANSGVRRTIMRLEQADAEQCRTDGARRKPVSCIAKSRLSIIAGGRARYNLRAPGVGSAARGDARGGEAESA